MDELEKAHEDYEKRKYLIINQLENLKLVSIGNNKLAIKWLEDAINFIKEKEI